MNLKITHCKRGHEFTNENTYIIPTTGCRNCRTCRTNYFAIRSEKRRLLRPPGRTLPELSLSDLGWAAGIIEGEGSIRINKASKRNAGALVVTISNTDQELVRWFHDRWGGYFKPNTVPTNPKYRQAWVWCLASKQAAAFLEQIRPYVRTEKYTRKLELALEFQRQKRPAGTVKSDPEYWSRQETYYLLMKTLTSQYRGG